MACFEYKLTKPVFDPIFGIFSYIMDPPILCYVFFNISKTIKDRKIIFAPLFLSFQYLSFKPTYKDI